MTVYVKLSPNSGHPSITDKFFKTRRCPLFRGSTVSKSILKPFHDFLGCPRPNLGHEQGSKLTQLLSITKLLLIWPEGHQEQVMRLPHDFRPGTSVRFEPETFWFWDWRDIPLSLLKTCNVQPNLIDLNYYQW